jgi:hypothetical protein
VRATRGFTALLSIAMAAATLVSTGDRAAAQDLPAQPSSPAAVEPTPAAAEPTPAAQTAAAPAEFAAGAPHVHTIAQGLMGVEGPLVWRVREVGLSATGAPESNSSSFTLQRTGAAIIRNELTSRRSRLEAGEAFFMPSGDPYLRYAVGSDPSIIWVVELLPPEAAAPGAPTTGTVLFTSDAINDYPRGTFDVELQRGILLPGEVSELPPHTGPALMMVTSGRLQATADGGQPSPISAGSGRLVTGALTLRNGDTQPAAFVVAALGEPVDGCVVDRKPITLTNDVTVPVETERGEVVDLGAFVRFARLVSVEVFHADQERRSRGAGGQPRDDRRAQVAQMELTEGANRPITRIIVAADLVQSPRWSVPRAGSR